MIDAPSGLVDQFNHPIKRADIQRLRSEVAPIGGQYARPPFEGHLAFGIDPRGLGGIIRAADTGNSKQWMIVAEQIEELFPHYTSVLSKRRRQVALLPITVQNADESRAAKKHGDFVRAWLETGVLRPKVIYDMLDALAKGYSAHEIIWETEPDAFRPKEFVHRAARHFETSWQDGETIWLRSENGFEELLPHKWMLHAHPTKTGQAQRSGLTRIVAFLWMYSAYTLKDWALFAQGYGLPIRIGRYGPEASDDDKATLWQAVSSIAGDVAAIVPKSMELEIVSGTDRSGGTELFLKRADWINREVSKLVLGSTAGTEAISGGHAVGKEHREVEADVENFDAGLLKTTLDRQVVAAMIAFTFGPQDRYPTLTIGRPEAVPLKDVIDAVADLGGMGLTVKASQLRELLQLEEPGATDETVGGIPPAPEPKPDIPRPAVEPPDMNARRWLGLNILTQSQAEPEVLDALTARLAEDAAGALHGLTETVRQAFHQAADLRDLAKRLHGLKLDAAEFAEALARGMALSNLVGQAAVVEELHTRQRIERTGS